MEKTKIIFFDIKDYDKEFFKKYDYVKISNYGKIVQIK